MKKVDHIGIAVKNLDIALPYYIETFGLKLLGIEEVSSQKVRVAFIDAGNVRLNFWSRSVKTVQLQSSLKKVGKAFIISLLALPISGREWRS